MLKRYIAEEIAQDCAEGLLSRREALRRLAALGVGAAVAAPLLAACGGDDRDDGDDGDDGGATATTAAATGTTATTAAEGRDDRSVAAGEAETITFEGTDGQLTAAFAAADDPKGAVLVVHENRGLTPHFFDVVGRLAGDGYSALAVDLLSPEGGTASLTDPAAAPAALGNAPSTRLLGDLRAGIDELARRAPRAPIGAMGFCFGGGMVWQLLATGEARLAAAVPFYGPTPEDADFTGSRAAVLAIYGEDDARVNATRPAAEAALRAADLTHEVKVFPDAGHAFFNDTGPRYDAAAAREAYADVLGWFGRHLR